MREEKILNEINKNKNSYKVNENKVDIFMLDEVESPNLPLDFTFDTSPSSFAQQPIKDSITLPEYKYVPRKIVRQYN